MAKKPLFALMLTILLGFDAAGHLSNLYLRAKGMRPMWVSEPREVERDLWPRLYRDLLQTEQTWQSTGNLTAGTLELRGDWSPRPQWRCPVHGDIISDISITVPGTDGPHHYCPRCLVELLDRMVLQVEEIPQAEEGTR